MTRSALTALAVLSLAATSAFGQVDIGSLEHDSQPLLDLAVMANEVSRVIYSRARAAGRFHV